MIRLLIYSLIFVCFIKNVILYSPVIILHGILSGPDNMIILKEEINKNHPGTKIYVSDRFSGWSSLENVWHQVDVIGNDIKEICEKHPEGVHLLGYSQGGLIARAILETNVNHCVKHFISLSSPQAGQYGTAFLHLIFPSLVAKTAYQLFYTYVGQHTSVANYWNDPHEQDLFYQFSQFLPYINNDLLTNNSTGFRDGLLKLKKIILIGGPHDGVITPWQSSHFGYFNSYDKVIPLHERDIYKRDRIGLKTLDKENKLIIRTYHHIRHLEWHRNKTVIKKAILPYLD